MKCVFWKLIVSRQILFKLIIEKYIIIDYYFEILGEHVLLNLWWFGPCWKSFNFVASNLNQFFNELESYLSNSNLHEKSHLTHFTMYLIFPNKVKNYI